MDKETVLKISNEYQKILDFLEDKLNVNIISWSIDIHTDGKEYVDVISHGRCGEDDFDVGVHRLHTTQMVFDAPKFQIKRGIKQWPRN